jgi:hypothetical protein
MAPSTSELSAVFSAFSTSLGAVVDRHQRHALGQRRLRDGELGLHGVDHGLGVLVDPRQRHAQHGFLAVAW